MKEIAPDTYATWSQWFPWNTDQFLEANSYTNARKEAKSATGRNEFLSASWRRVWGIYAAATATAAIRPPEAIRIETMPIAKPRGYNADTTAVHTAAPSTGARVRRPRHSGEIAKLNGKPTIATMASTASKADISVMRLCK